MTERKMNDNLELYRRLGFEDNTATEKQIKDRYRRIVMNCHPDKFPGDDDKAEQFRSVQEAYEILSNPEKRKVYDETGTFNNQNVDEELTQMSIKLLVETFNMMMDTLPEQAMDMMDIREPLFDNIRQNVTQNNNAIKKCESTLRKLKKAQIKLTKSKDSEMQSDILQYAMGERIGVLNSEIKMHQNVLKVCAKMKEILEDYKYDFSKPIMQQLVNTNSTSTTNKTYFGFKRGG